jgi:sugar transferase (PEP-CTERM/EpsH1 system associated)
MPKRQWRLNLPAIFKARGRHPHTGADANPCSSVKTDPTEMNLLYLAHRIPYPPNKGDKIRAFHQLRHLAQRYTVHLACLVDDLEDLPYVKDLEKCCASVEAVYRGKTAARLRALTALATGKPLSVASFSSRALQRHIARRLRTAAIDRIVVFSSAMAEYVRDVTGIPKVIDFVDADSEKWRLYADHQPFPWSQLYRLEAKRLARYEAEAASWFDHAVFISDAEAQVLRGRTQGQPVTVIPNGVDTDYFSPHGGGQPPLGEPCLVFTGEMNYFPNVDAVRHFCRAILPLVKRLVPNVRFYIVGRYPTRQVRALADGRHVVVTGAVPDVRPYLGVAHLAVAPFRIARGIQNKVLEAMAMGLPVVGTAIALRGLQATAADGVRIADHPEAFAQEVLALLQDPLERRRCAHRARQFVCRHHRWQEHGARLEALLQALG